MVQIEREDHEHQSLFKRLNWNFRSLLVHSTEIQQTLRMDICSVLFFLEQRAVPVNIGPGMAKLPSFFYLGLYMLV